MKKIFLKKNYTDYLHKNIDILREKESFVDVALACGGKLFKAHRIVLCSSSEYFNEMLASTNNQYPIVYMKDTSCDTVQALLEFIYCGETNVAQENLNSFLKVAKEFKINGLNESQIEEGCFNSCTVNENSRSKRIRDSKVTQELECIQRPKKLRCEGSNASCSQEPNYSSAGSVLSLSHQLDYLDNSILGLPSELEFLNSIPEEVLSPAIPSNAPIFIKCKENCAKENISIESFNNSEASMEINNVGKEKNASENYLINKFEKDADADPSYHMTAFPSGLEEDELIIKEEPLFPEIVEKFKQPIHSKEKVRKVYDVLQLKKEESQLKKNEPQSRNDEPQLGKDGPQLNKDEPQSKKIQPQSNIDEPKIKKNISLNNEGISENSKDKAKIKPKFDLKKKIIVCFEDVTKLIDFNRESIAETLENIRKRFKIDHKEDIQLQGKIDESSKFLNIDINDENAIFNFRNVTELKICHKSFATREVSGTSKKIIANSVIDGQNPEVKVNQILQIQKLPSTGPSQPSPLEKSMAKIELSNKIFVTYKDRKMLINVDREDVNSTIAIIRRRFRLNPEEQIQLQGKINGTTKYLDIDVDDDDDDAKEVFKNSVELRILS